jgi:hypothetical protein
MKRFLILAVLLVCSLPVGFSIAGCAGTNPNNYCNKSGYGYGLKTNQVAAISLGPATTGISLAYGQTGQLSSPTATNCNGGTQSVAGYTYGSSNINLVDVSPTGALCGGTWNRTSPGGIADYTICTAPTPAAVNAGCTGSAPHQTCVGLLTASADGVTSNTVAVYVHPAVSSITLSVAAPDGGASGYTGCFSQNQTSQLDAVATIATSTGEAVFCAPPGDPSGAPDCSTNLGHFTYTPVNANIVTIDPTSGIATAHQPGSTAITAAISAVSSTAGSFSTCPPASIQLQIPSTISTNPVVGVVKPGTNVPLNTIVTDTQGNQITGVALDYSSTNPMEISVGSGGAVSTTYPSTAAITAICNPPTCNPSIITQIGKLGNGIPIVSNSVQLTSTGRNSTLLWMASPQSDFFAPVDLSTGTIGSPIKLPYIPNSMVLDAAGSNLYFGNYRELMVFNATSNALSKEDTTVPGVVLAVSPDSTTVVIADQVRQVIYLYTASSGAHTSIGGLATRAQFSPDSKTLYVAGPNSLYIHNLNSGWSIYPNLPTQTGAGCNLNNNNYATGTAPFTPFCSPDLSVTVPGEGAFLSGPNETTAYSFCPDTSGTQPVFYPSAIAPGVTLPPTDHLTTTTDRIHILGANPTTLTDIFLGTPATPGVPTENIPGAPTGTCIRPTVNTVTGLQFTTSTVFTQPLPSTISPTAIDQVVASPDSTIAFVTYTGSSSGGQALLPYYQLSSAFVQGTLGAVPLSGTATAPLAGAFSPDNSTFFVGTAGDNLVHLIDVPSLTDTKTINPGLLDPTGTAVPVQFFAVKPRPTT